MSEVLSTVAGELRLAAAKLGECAEQQELVREASVWLRLHSEQFFVIPMVEALPHEKRRSVHLVLDAAFLHLRARIHGIDEVAFPVSCSELLNALDYFASQGPFARMSKRCYQFLNPYVLELIAELQRDLEGNGVAEKL